MLKKTTLVLLVLSLLAGSLFSQVKVRGYYRKDGTYVRPHTRTSPDGNPYNNYSFPGNYNPNTGKISTGNPETYLKNYYNRSTTPSSGNVSLTQESTYSGSSDVASTSTPLSPKREFQDIFEYASAGEYSKISSTEIDDLITYLSAIKAKLTDSSVSVPTQGQSPTYYYVVVYSETDFWLASQRVEQCKATWPLNTYEYKIYPAIVSGRKWYRVVLGIFPSYGNAKEKLQELSLHIPSDSWVIKY